MDHLSYRSWLGPHPPAPTGGRRNRILLITTITAVIAVLLAATAASVWERRERMLDGKLHELESLALALAEQSERAFQAVGQVMETTAAAAVAPGGEAHLPRRQRDELLRARIAGFPQIQAHTVWGRDGRVIAGTEADPSGDPAAPVPAWAHGQEASDIRTYVWLPVQGGAAGWPGIPIVRNLHDASGAFVGRVSASLDPHYFTSVYSNLKLDAGTQVKLIRDDGHAVAGYPPVWLARDAPAGPPRTGGVAVRYRIEPLRSGRLEHDGQGWLYARTFLPEFPFYVDIRVPQAAILATWETPALVVGGAALTFALALALLTALLVRQLARQERAARNAVEQCNVIRTVFNAVPNPVYVKDREGRFLAANEDMVRGFHLPLSVLIGRRTEDLYPDAPEENQPSRDEDRLVLEQGQEVDVRRWRRMGERLSFIHFVKRPLRDAAGAITGLVGVAVDETPQLRAQEEIQHTRTLLAAVFDTIPLAIYVTDLERRLAMANREAALRWCLTPQQMEGMPWDALPISPGQRRVVNETYDQVLQDGGLLDYETVYPYPDGKTRRVRVIKTPLHDASGTVSGVLTVSEDISEEYQVREEKAGLEKQLNQIQKLETVGRLAGGIAHDFNNLLTPIRGYAELGLSKLPADHPVAEGLARIVDATSRAAALTQGLLTFGRSQALQLAPLDLNGAVQAVHNMVGRLIGADIEIALHLDPTVGSVLADRTQLDQVLMNLVVNARDAMPEGGRIVIETSKINLDAEHVARILEVPPGRYVMLTVSDSGTGMDRDTQAKIFEPFFTTKELGQGTGLGLSIVHGIVRQHNGAIRVYSEPGQGTSFKILLPLHSLEGAQPEPIEEQGALLAGDERVLVVDDDTLVRNLVCAVLEAQGYRVLHADSPQAALALLDTLGNPAVDLLVSDVVMPGMSGPQLYAELRAHLPALRVLFMSGHPRDILKRAPERWGGANYLGKPFSVYRLASQVRRVLEDPVVQDAS